MSATQTMVGRTEAGFAAGRTDKMPSKLPDYSQLIGDMREVFRTGKTKNLTWRKQQLNQIKKMITENYEEMVTAIQADLGGNKMRAVFDFSGALEEATYTLDNLDKWAADEKSSFEIPLQILDTAVVRKEPKGVLLLISPWNFPLELTLHPLVSVIAAGNCCVIKPSEVSPAVSALLKKLCDKYLDTECIKVVEGAVPETLGLLEERYDHILYTGNGVVARSICKTAAKHLTPVTLELGGKSPVYIDESASVSAAINRIGGAKFMNCGQICIAPDFLLVHRSKFDAIVKGLKNLIEKEFGASVKDQQSSPDWGRIVHERHVKRVQRLIETSKGEVVIGGCEGIDVADKFIPPTLILNPSLDDPVMLEEIFGPVLPILPVDSMEEAIETMNQVCPDPLALYVFAENKDVVKEVLNRTQSGGACVNTCMEQVQRLRVPFGGIGDSGMGAYHGKAGFDEFSHRRSVVIKDTKVHTQAVAPLKDGDKLYPILIKFFVTGFLTKTQKLFLKLGGGALTTVLLAYLYKTFMGLA